MMLYENILQLLMNKKYTNRLISVDSAMINLDDITSFILTLNIIQLRFWLKIETSKVSYAMF